MGVVAYAFLHEGLLTAFCMLCNTIIAGLVAFNYFEPVALELEEWFAGTFLTGFEDCFGLMALFCGTLLVLRVAVNKLADEDLDLHARIQQVGSGLCGLLTGYLASGFLVCVFQTLPWSEDFMGFQYRVDPSEQGHQLRRYLPPDRVWLAMMHRAGLYPLSKDDPPSPFDPDGSFEARYARQRRTPADEPAPTPP
jgi:hypothetical protein